MKLTSLFKSVRVIGLMSLLSITVGIAKVEANGSANKNAADTFLAAQPTSASTIVEIAAGKSNFSTLVKAVQAAGLAETLSGEGPFTLFAPTNKAFAALPKGTLEKLLKPENRDLLRKVLTYHVVSGDLMSHSLRSDKVTTLQGSSVTLRVRDQGIRVNKANVIKADIDAKNGVIHVIDRVLLPANL
jgi:uncharacterized surface protein with fasciclin (FAS1) repeats